MFNKRDQRCAAVQHMLFTDPSYDDNRTMASTLKMQIWIATNNRDVPMVMKTKFPATVMVFGVLSSEGHIMPHLRSRFKSQHQSVRGCTEECGDPLVQSGGWWQILGVAAGLGAGPQVQRDSGLASEGVLRLWTLLSGPLPPPSWTRWTTSFCHTSRISPTWLSTTPNPAWSLLWKRHTPSSGSVSRRWLRLKAATLNRCQLYYIIKLSELIFSIKLLK